MSRSVFCAGASALILLSACTQPPAEVALKGQHVYGPSGARSGGPPPEMKVDPRYTAPVDMETNQDAAVAAIEVTELDAPVQEKNPWTGKPRAEFSKTAPAAGGEPFIWPVSGRKILSGFGPKGRGKANDGVNIAADSGEPVWAAADGEVVYAGDQMSGYGTMVLIKHLGDKTTTYAHLSRIAVDKYDRVKQGDIIGYVGQTGSAKRPQLHFAVRDGKRFVDPKKYL